MVGWHHRLDGHGFGWTTGVGDGQGGLACCGSWGRKESDRTERLNWTEQYKFLNNILNTIIWKMNLVGFFWKIIQSVDLIQRNLTKQGHWLLFRRAYTFSNKASILQMCPKRKLCKNLNSDIIRLLPHNCAQRTPVMDIIIENCQTIATLKCINHRYNHTNDYNQ